MECLPSRNCEDAGPRCEAEPSKEGEAHVTMIPADAGRSWWLRDALAEDPGDPAPPLRGDLMADVVILGGGYTGMWTALQLKELDAGIDVAILEQDIVGGG